jgi:hypothetical protein
LPSVGGRASRPVSGNPCASDGYRLAFRLSGAARLAITTATVLTLRYVASRPNGNGEARLGYWRQCPKSLARNRLLEPEANLDDQFADRTVNEESLKRSISDIALTQGELRATHLKYHLSARSILSDEQLAKYAELRGYAGGSMPAHRQHHLP